MEKKQMETLISALQNLPTNDGAGQKSPSKSLIDWLVDYLLGNEYKRAPRPTENDRLTILSIISGVTGGSEPAQLTDDERLLVWIIILILLA